MQIFKKKIFKKMDTPLQTLPLPALSTDGEVPINILDNDFEQPNNEQPTIVEYPYYSSCTRIHDCWNQTETKEFIKTTIFIIVMLIIAAAYITLIVVSFALIYGYFDTTDVNLNTFKSVIGFILLISLVMLQCCIVGCISAKKKPTGVDRDVVDRDVVDVVVDIDVDIGVDIDGDVNRNVVDADVSRDIVPETL
jgi:hypothetical protein